MIINTVLREIGKEPISDCDAPEVPEGAVQIGELPEDLRRLDSYIRRLFLENQALQTQHEAAEDDATKTAIGAKGLALENKIQIALAIREFEIREPFQGERTAGSITTGPNWQVFHLPEETENHAKCPLKNGGGIIIFMSSELF